MDSSTLFTSPPFKHKKKDSDDYSFVISCNDNFYYAEKNILLLDEKKITKLSNDIVAVASNNRMVAVTDGRIIKIIRESTVIKYIKTKESGKSEEIESKSISLYICKSGLLFLKNGSLMFYRFLGKEEKISDAVVSVGVADNMIFISKKVKGNTGLDAKSRRRDIESEVLVEVYDIDLKMIYRYKSAEKDLDNEKNFMKKICENLEKKRGNIFFMEQNTSTYLICGEYLLFSTENKEVERIWGTTGYCEIDEYLFLESKDSVAILNRNLEVIKRVEGKLVRGGKGLVFKNKEIYDILDSERKQKIFLSKEISLGINTEPLTKKNQIPDFNLLDFQNLKNKFPSRFLRDKELEITEYKFSPFSRTLLDNFEYRRCFLSALQKNNETEMKGIVLYVHFKRSLKQLLLDRECCTKIINLTQNMDIEIFIEIITIIHSIYKDIIQKNITYIQERIKKYITYSKKCIKILGMVEGMKEYNK